MPIQHASDAILKRMGRRTSRQELIDIITKLRKEIPDIALRTTLITGFPGETKQDHEQMMEFVDSMEFDRLGVFTYSPEAGPPAADMDNQIDEEVKEQWRDEVMELQQEVSLDKSADMVGKTIEVMIEGKISDDEAYVGRSYKDAPNVDGFVFVNTTANLMSGEMVRVNLRKVMNPFFILILYTDWFHGYDKIIAAVIFIAASLTDMLDGKIARKYNLVTNFGKFMDPLADKLLVCSALIALVDLNKIAAWIVIIIIAREFIISGFRLVASDNGVVIAASYWGKFKTTFQMLMIIYLVVDLQFAYANIVGMVLVYVALALTVISLVDYIAKNYKVFLEGSSK